MPAKKSDVEGPDPARELSTAEILSYRLLPALAGLAIALLGPLHGGPEGPVDPSGLRAVAALSCELVVVVSFLAGRRATRPALYGAIGIVSAWVLALLALNRFSIGYALTLLLVMTVVAACVADHRQLAVYCAATLGTLGLIALATPHPRIPLVIYLPFATVLGVLSVLSLALRNRSERELARSEERYALAAWGANDGLWDWDRSTGVVVYSARWKEMLGYAEGEINGRADEWLLRVHPDDRERVQLAIDRCPPGSHFSVEYRIAYREGGWRWMQARGARLPGGADRLAGSQSDITARKSAEAQLERHALFDPRTGLANRALCLDRLDRLARRPRSGPGASRFAVLFLDLDRFRVVNDSLGHRAGDDILAEVARRLEPLVGADDTLAHLGADDFVLALEGADGEEALRVARRLKTAVARPYHIEGQEVSLSVTVGIALGAAGASADELLRDAELAMYRAKKGGGARVRLFDAAMHREIMERLRLEGELRRGIDRGELSVHFQPIADLRSARITSAEGLVRWRHPRRGLLAPADFLPLAEETGLILPLGHAVLRAAAATIAAWKDSGVAPPLGVQVNVSPALLLDPTLVEAMAALLREYALSPGELGIEITEGAVMGDPGVALERLTQLRRLGVNVAVDDFGTGYSSLSYLHRFPVDTLKVDRSFIAGLAREDPRTGREWELVRTIVLLGRNLGLDVVAEGIESPRQLKEVRRLGCDRGQGFLFAPPLPPDEYARQIDGIAARVSAALER